jgi:hypothetical protein
MTVAELKPLLKMAAFRAYVLCALALLVYGEERGSAPTVPYVDLTPTGMTRDIWFWIFVGWYVFSALVTGMPEPTQESSPWYIWAYRSFHILAASGTSFFQNKMYWPNSVTGPLVTQSGEKPAKVV